MSHRTLAVLVSLVLVALAAGTAGARIETPLVERAANGLASFERWLARRPGEPARGFIGEVGWPGNPSAGGDARWNDVARAWYADAGRAGLWVAAWAAGDRWAGDYRLLVYGTGPSSSRIATPQAAVVEAQPSPWLRGVNLAGPEFGSPVDEPTSSFSNERSGVDGPDYSYPSPLTLAALAARGVGFVRLPVRWERIQPEPDGPLDGAESSRLVATVEAAGAAGLGVVVDLHNYGAYYLADPGGLRGIRRPIGSPQVPIGDFADLWRRLSALLEDKPAVIGYGLMNEPVGMSGPRSWEAASRAAVAAIRSNGDRKRVFVQSYSWGGVAQFSELHPRGPWIADRNVWYEAHQYFDADGSARYAASYDDELAARRLSARLASEPSQHPAADRQDEPQDARAEA